MVGVTIPLLVILFIPSAFGLKNKQDGIRVNRELKNLCKSRISAFAGRDAAKLGNICAEGYRLITQTGTQMNLKEVRESISSKNRKLSSFTLYSFQSFVADDGSMAFAVAEVTEEVVIDKTSPVTNNLLVTEVYVKHSGKWKIQLTHVSQKMCIFPE